ncbi:hypothetical protein [Mesorhizobium caraganae]
MPERRCCRSARAFSFWASMVSIAVFALFSAAMAAIALSRAAI